MMGEQDKAPELGNLGWRVITPLVGATLILVSSGVWSDAAWAEKGHLASESVEVGSEVEASDGEEEDAHGHGEEGASRLTAEEIPLQLEGFPQRPKPILELGERFLGTGTLGKGLKLPTGAVWQPALVAFGTFRTAVQSFDRGDDQVSEVVARLDFFGNLALSGTERLVVGFRSLDENGRFTSYILDSDRPGLEDGLRNELNTQVQSLFFEGELGEIFPGLSRNDFKSADYGFSLGRQPLLFQEGLLINDSIDGLGVTRNTFLPDGTSNFRATFFYGWDNINRSDRGQGRRNLEDRSAQLFAVLTSTDFPSSTLDIDAAYVRSDDDTRGDLVAVGISGVQRLGALNTSFRVLSSLALDDETAVATDGTLLLSELSWTPHHSHDLFYITSFVAKDDFSSASRDPATGGPLGRAGINFASVGLGNYGAPLSNQARDVGGGAIGYQKFFDHTRKQVLVELGLRLGLEDDVENQAAVTARYQSAFGRHFVVVVDGFAGYREGIVPGAGDDTLFGGRLELVTKF